VIPDGAQKLRSFRALDFFNCESATLPILEGFLDFQGRSLDAQKHDRLTTRQAPVEEADGRTFVRGHRLEFGRPRTTRDSHRYGDRSS
jgi:hypothetical protein